MIILNDLGSCDWLIIVWNRGTLELLMLQKFLRSHQLRFWGRFSQQIPTGEAKWGERVVLSECSGNWFNKWMWYLDLEKEVVVNIKPPFGEYVHIFSKHRTSKSKCFPHSCFNSQVWRFNVYITYFRENEQMSAKKLPFQNENSLPNSKPRVSVDMGWFLGRNNFPLRKKWWTYPISSVWYICLHLVDFYGKCR